MANHPNRNGKYELVFVGGPDGKRYRRMHRTLETAIETAYRVLGEMDNRGAHPAIIYGPDQNNLQGVTIP